MSRRSGRASARGRAGPALPLALALALASSFLAAGPRTAAAQEGAWRITAGAAWSRLVGEDIDEDDRSPRIAPRVAVAYDRLLRGRLGVAPELAWVGRGDRLDDSPVDARLELDYLQIAVPMTLEVARAAGWRVRAFAGPTLAMELRCESFVDDGRIDVTEDCSAATHRFDPTGMAGLDVSGLVAGWRWTLRGGLDAGVRTLDAAGNDVDVRHRTFFLEGGVSFPTRRTTSARTHHRPADRHGRRLTRLPHS